VASETLAKLQGEWVAVKLMQDGREMPAVVTGTGKRVAAKNELKVWFGGQLMIHALVRIEESKSPMEVDYLHQAGPLAGTVQYGIMRWEGEEVVVSMSAPGTARPGDFSCGAGRGETLSRWRRKK
jgi:uncharacterized protein (TIGR03067 family)